MDKHNATEQAYHNGYADGFADAKKLYCPCRIGDRVWGIRKYNERNTLKCGRVSKMEFDTDMDLCITVKNAVRGKWGKDYLPRRMRPLRPWGGYRRGA